MKRNIATVLAVLGLALLAPHANSQPTCIPFAAGVPANATPPHWWDNNPPQSAYYQRLSDPRWVGSAKITYGDGTTVNTTFQALQDGTFLYLSWRFTGMPAGTPEQNILWVGLHDGGNDQIIKINLKTLTATADQSGGLISETNYYPLIMSGGKPKLGAVQPTPSWLSDTMRVWINADGYKAPPNDTMPNPTPNTWAVQMRVPIANVTDVNNPMPFKLWYEVLTGTPSTPLIEPSTWPRTNASVTVDLSDGKQVFPDPATVWQQFSSAAGCMGQGVSLDYLQIGTLTGDTILYKQNNQASWPGDHPKNTFFARPQNNSGINIPAGGIQATFRIANWGSMPNWEDGVPVDTLWSKIECPDSDGPAPNNVCTMPIGNVGVINNGTLATAANDSHFDWFLSNSQLAPFQAGTKRADNCLLVDLTSPIGLTFTNSSVRRNMLFESASTVKKTADITIKGLPAIAPDGRDVYIWVEALHMPSVSTPQNQPTQLETTEPPRPIPPEPGDGGGDIRAAAAPRPRAQEPTPGKPIPIPDANTLRQMAAEGRVTQAQLDAAVPSYRVHVYYDTGRTMNVDGTNRPVLRPQGSFGYFVSHQGALYGWQHQLVGDGFTLEQLAPDFYRIKKVPNDGVVRVSTTTTALETKPGTILGIPWWVWILLLLILILVLIVWIRR